MRDRTRMHRAITLRPAAQSTILSALFLSTLLFLSTSLFTPAAQSQSATPAGSGTEVVLHAVDAAKLLPPAVFFRGQSATTQVRNSGGVRFQDGFYLLASLVDTSGYSTGVQAKYQACLLTEVPIEINGKRLPAGAYGVGFIAGNKFDVLDIGAHDIFTVDSVRDMDIRRPTPLQVQAAPEAHHYRLYSGRSYVTIARAD